MFLDTSALMAPRGYHVSKVGMFYFMHAYACKYTCWSLQSCDYYYGVVCAFYCGVYYSGPVVFVGAPLELAV